MRYSFRASLIENEKTYVLTKKGLVVLEDGEPVERIAWADVRAVNLQFNGSMYGTSRYRCVITTASGKLALTNAHFVGIGDFEQRDAEFSRFVAGLHVALRPYADGIRFTQGSNLLFLVALGFAVLMPPLYLALLYILFVKQGDLGMRGRISLVMLPALLSLLVVPVLRKGRPQSYDPAQVPEAYLPVKPAPVRKRAGRVVKPRSRAAV